MKKLLALVLALVMTLSLAVVGSNAAFKDAEKVNASYAEAVDVLAGMKVFQGYPDNSFQPEGSITRAEVAAIVYRLYTADVADKQASLYATYNKFTDMGGAAWAAGYIGYCANAGLIKGYDAKTFGPADKVTGYQALAMILRAVGYDKNDEFTGAQWQLRVASTAQQLGILKNVTGVDLNAAASRELVAELLFRTAAEVPMVTYTPALGYTNLTAILNGKANATLGEKNFGLAYTESKSDEWGRPYYVWYDARDTKDGKYVALTSTLYATVKATPVKTYTEAVTECQVAEDYGFKATKEFTVYTNGFDNSAKKTLNAINTVDKIGAQGRLTEVYKDRIVYIDTLLAEVTYVANATFDTAGHLKTPSTITMKVYDKGAVRANPTVAYEYTTVTETNSSTNYEYAKGDMILVYAVQNANAKVVNTAAKQYVELNGKATSVVGAQSTIWANNAKHVVGGTTYNDAYRFHFDQAANEVTNHTWYFDSYGNLIGASDIVSNNYAVLKSLRWIVGAPGHAEAVLVDMTGAESTVTVSKIDGQTGSGTFSFTSPSTWSAVGYGVAYSNPVSYCRFDSSDKVAYVSDEGGENSIYSGYALYRIDTNLDSTVNLVGQNAVKFDGSAKFSANGSAILKNDGTFLTYVNSSTQYLVRTVDAKGVATYTPVTGTQAMAAYSNAKLFYVDANNDNVAEYVYIYSGTKVGATDALVYVTTPAYTNGLTNGTGVSTIVANVNGVADQTLTAEANTTTDNTAKIRELAQNVGTLYKVTLTNGYVTAVAPVTTPVTVDAIPGYSVAYLGTAVTVSGDTLMGNGLSVRAIDANGTASTIISNETDVKLDTVALAGKGVWAVYTNYVGAYNNMAKFIYVGSKPAATASAAATAIGVEYLPAFDQTDATVASVKAQLLAMANKKLADAGLTGVTVEITGLNNGSASPAVALADPIAHSATPITLWYSFKVTDNLGNTANSSATAYVNNKYSSATANTAVANALKSMTVDASTVSNQATIEAAIKANLDTAFAGHTPVFTVTMTSTPDIAAKTPVSVTVTGTVEGQAVSVSGTVYLA